MKFWSIWYIHMSRLVQKWKSCIFFKTITYNNSTRKKMMFNVIFKKKIIYYTVSWLHNWHTSLGEIVLCLSGYLGVLSSTPLYPFLSFFLLFLPYFLVFMFFLFSFIYLFLLNYYYYFYFMFKNSKKYLLSCLIIYFSHL